MSPYRLDEFCELVWNKGEELYRDLPWRNLDDPYQVWLSEVMLQQTQVSRVITRWQEWLERFPQVEALAFASSADVLEAWQGMGYNRRALALKAAAEIIETSYRGVFPRSNKELQALPGIGPATAAGIRCFAFGLPDTYLETNVRTVLLHELFPDETAVPDSLLEPLVSLTCPPASSAGDKGDACRGPRVWYYALLDYGAQLKRELPNPSRRSKHHSVQSKFEGSYRQKRSFILKQVLANPEGLGLSEIAVALNSFEERAGRRHLSLAEVEAICAKLCAEGFMKAKGSSEYPSYQA